MARVFKSKGAHRDLKMSNTFVRLDGVEELERAVRRVSEAVQGRALEAAVAAGADVLVHGMETRAPRQHGDLEMSIIKHPSKVTSERAVFDVGPAKLGFHGMFQELGTFDMAPQPFMRPTFDEDGDMAVKVVSNELRRGVLRG